MKTKPTLGEKGNTNNRGDGYVCDREFDRYSLTEVCPDCKYLCMSHNPKGTKPPKQKERKIYKRIYDSIYFADVRLQVGGKRDSHLSCWVQRHEKLPEHTIWYVVYMEDKEDFYGLIHECVHLVKMVFKDRHIPFTATNDEAIAYYLSWWFKQLWRKSHK